MRSRHVERVAGPDTNNAFTCMVFVGNVNLLLRFTILIRGRNTYAQHYLKRERASCAVAVRMSEKVERLESNKAVVN